MWVPQTDSFVLCVPAMGRIPVKGEIAEKEADKSMKKIAEKGKEGAYSAAAAT